MHCRLMALAGGAFLVLMMGTPVAAQEGESLMPKNWRQQLRGKVPALVSRGTAPKVSPRPRDFSRIIPDPEQAKAMAEKFAQPLSDEDMEALRQARLERLERGGLGLSMDATNRRRVRDGEEAEREARRIAHEPKDEGDGILMGILGAFIALGLVILRLRKD
ncbi:MAG TPA: hypothetical protein ENK43_10015 [Planctomycetes bacterium]|nr:hypothetical protein [Planctomycetota bacterium]